MNQENQGVNYSMALKNYNQNGRGRSMRKQGVSRRIRQAQCLYVFRNRELQDEQTIGKRR